MTGTMLKPAHTEHLARATARRFLAALEQRRSRLALVHLRLRNAWTHSPVTGTAGVVVSMSAYGRGVRTAHLALESIARGTVKPKRLILWLDDPALRIAEQPGLRRLQRRGLEVRHAPNLGPHTKYYPWVKCGDDPQCPLVTAGHGTIYPARWLKPLVDANLHYPDMVHGYSVSVIGTNGGSITQCGAWARRHNTRPGFNNVANSSVGAIYPPTMQRELRNRGELFMDVCPGAGDLWLHWVALRAGIPARQIEATPRDFPVIPGSADPAPNEGKLTQRGIDRWTRGLYSAEDISALAAPRDAGRAG